MNEWKKLNFCVPITESLKADNGDFFIRGVAINATTTRNRTRFEAAELQASAPTLRNKPLLKDHNNSVDSIVGRTTNNVNFDVQTQAVMFEAYVIDEAIQKKINAGLIQNVSIGAVLTKDPEIIKDSEGNVEAIVAKGIDFVELSLVAVPADPNAGFAKALMESFDLKVKEESQYACQKCNQSFTTKEALSVHMSDKHAEPDGDETGTDTDDDGDGNQKLTSTSILEAADMAEEIKTLEALRAAREQLEMECEALKIEKLNAQKAELSKTEAVTEKTDLTKGVVESSSESVQDDYLVERNGNKFSVSKNLSEMKASPFTTEKAARYF